MISMSKFSIYDTTSDLSQWSSTLINFKYETIYAFEEILLKS